MNLNSIFTKPVDRYIEGVIKADDEAGLRLELEEYILTNEVEKRLEAFLDAYNNYEGANGVWISGFFGSGKSHLLKILSLLLEDKEIEGVRPLDVLLPKCADNEILRGDLKRAVEIPSKSILFNIDQKSDTISKKQLDAVLSVFVKVFNEMRGYYGKQGHIAQFERDLDSRDLYQAFREVYASIADKPWERGREQAILEAAAIDKAYAKVSGTPEGEVKGIISKYRDDYKVSIEDFADQVKEYLDQQGADFRLNFCVDEVGQFVADHPKLMTNLQTVAESLATKCRGRAWVLVTAQEDMDSVIGEMTAKQSNDFSKIQARFATRMKLTSADVAEVIQRRLLEKNETGIAELSTVYHEQANNFKTLFSFSDGGVTYRHFQDREHFIHTYPFIPYQFALFQSAIQNLSQHNAFEGKSKSVGERSMLEVFQQVAIHVGGHALGQLATFDMMFEGIRSTLKANSQKAILVAEKNLGNPFALRLLKALLLVKYVREFKATQRNLCVLMLEHFDQDLTQLKRQVEEALNILEQQTYIQRNGEVYEYLTDEEKDVEQEIKHTEIETSDVNAELDKLIFDYVIKDRKLRYVEAGQDFIYSKKLDDRLLGREHELAINVITPFHEHADNIERHRTDTVYKDEVRALLPVDDRLMFDVLMYKRTEKYIRHNMSMGQQESIKRILTDKGYQNQERYKNLQRNVRSLLGKARIFVRGRELDLGGEDPQTRISNAFQELVPNVYHNLKMLRGVAYSENDVGRCLAQANKSLFAEGAAALTEPEQELLSFVQSNERGGLRTTIKTLTENFETKPYGWSYAAVLCNLANLCGRGKLEVRADAQILEDAALERAIRNTQAHANSIVTPLVEFTASQVRALKEFHDDFFDQPPAGSDAKMIGKETGAAMAALYTNLKGLAEQTAQYPFLSALNPVLDMLNALQDKPYTWYVTEFKQTQDALLDLKEAVIDPIRKFMGGSQRQIYLDAVAFLNNQKANFTSIEGDEADQLTTLLSHPECFKGTHLQTIKQLTEDLKSKVSAQVTLQAKQAKDAIDALRHKLTTVADYAKLDTEQQAQLMQPFAEAQAKIENEALIAVIRDIQRQLEEQYPSLLTSLSAWATPEQPTPQEYPGGKSVNHPGVSEGKLEYVPVRSIAVAYEGAWLANEADLESYLELLRTAMLEQIKQGKRIQI